MMKSYFCSGVPLLSILFIRFTVYIYEAIIKLKQRYLSILFIRFKEINEEI